MRKVFYFRNIAQLEFFVTIQFFNRDHTVHPLPVRFVVTRCSGDEISLIGKNVSVADKKVCARYEPYRTLRKQFPHGRAVKILASHSGRGARRVEWVL